MPKATRPKDFDCPVCGETVPGGSKSCPECGACEKSGWGEESYLDGVDLPDEDSYDGVGRREFSRGETKSFWQRAVPIIALLMLIALILPLLRSCEGR